MRKLGELLLQAGKINQKQLQEALALQKRAGRPPRHEPGQARATSPSSELVDFLSKHFGVPSVDLDRVEVDEAVIKIIPADVARKYTILPIAKAGATVTIAMIDPTNVFAMDDIKFMTGYNVEPVVASETALRAVDRPLLRLDPRDRAQEGDGGPRRGGATATSRSSTRRRSSTSRRSRRSPRRRRSSAWSTSS